MPSNISAKKYKLKSEVILYPGEAAWYFAVVPMGQSLEIQKKFAKYIRGWGSLRVRATVGKTIWDTSIFLQKKTGTYLLPIKAAVRKKEGIQANEAISFSIEVLI